MSVGTVSIQSDSDANREATRVEGGVSRWLKKQWPAIVTAVVVIALWEMLGQTLDLLYLPPLTSVLAALWTLIEEGTLLTELRASVIALAIGLVVAIVIGVLVGTTMAVSEKVRFAIDVYIDGLMAAPMVAFIPLFIMVFGLGPITRVLLVMIFAFFPVVINVDTGLRNVDRSLIEMGKSFGAGRWRLFWQVRVPAAYGAISAGIRLGTARGVDGLITGEVLIAVAGLGGLITRYGNAFTSDRLYAVVIVVLGLALLVTGSVQRLGRTAFGSSVTNRT